MNVTQTNSQESRPRYALIMPVRDEAKFIGAMIESILAQEFLPAKWIIVDDGSMDNTAEIIRSYARKAKFIELVQLPHRERREPGGEAAITHALKRLSVAEYDFLARFDADLLFAPDYLSQIMGEFSRNPKLGIAGGGLYVEKGAELELEKVPEYHVRGALKMYRRECFEQIGGITAQIGWDTTDEVYAWSRGWKTQSFFQYRVIHRRPTGEGIDAIRVYWQRGKADYYTWSHPAFVLGKSAKLAISQISILKPAIFLVGFISCYLRRECRLKDPIFIKTRRSQQMRRSFSLFSERNKGTDNGAVVNGSNSTLLWAAKKTQKAKEAEQQSTPHNG
jgi:biofilm PGA synthesis N-glycosyltransferase PgaC